ncbi:MAG: cysteine desulfurase [Acidobacteriota bacterium]|nr:MAG: cysteine desulfurase [Acidobacteriota bacterium]
MKRVYLDHNATCPVDPRVRDAVAPFLEGDFGNPSSVHRFGQAVRAAVERAREQVARLLNADVDEIVFTSGGTESDNLALHGAVRALRQKAERPHVITSAIEHPAVADTAEALKDTGCDVTYLPVTREGLVTPDVLRQALRKETVLVSVMLTNNEIGVIEPVEELVPVAHDAGALFHCDAVQAVGKIPVDVRALGADLVSVSGHKFYALKGAGALYVKRDTPMECFVTGGHQEEGRRGGTENVVGIVGMGRAAELARTEFLQAAPHVAALRDKLEKGILEKIPNVQVNGSRERRVSNTLNVSFKGVDGEAVLISLDLKGVAVSTGSACSSGSVDPSPVLESLGISKEDNKASIRFSLGVGTTEEDIEYVLKVLPSVVKEIRKISMVA